MAASTSSLWQSLDSSKREIRLLQINPARGDNSRLDGRFIITSLLDTNHNEYFAVSHAWGLAQGIKVIYLEGQEIFVSQDLYQCLTYFRHEATALTLWLDAICIHQSNLEEKASQVASMPHIFGQATHVRVWLGWDIPSVVDLVRRIVNRQGISPDIEEAEFQLLLAQVSLFNRLAWWSRLWVRQEAGLAQSMHFWYRHLSFASGDLSIFNGAWKRCIDNIWFDDIDILSIRREAAIFRNNISHVQSLRTALREGLNLSSKERALFLMSALKESRRSDVADPRDRIFGQLGVINRATLDDFLNVDYTATIASVYTEFAFRLIRFYKSLSILNQACVQHNAVTSLPSWVPDWSSRYNFAWEELRLRRRNSQSATNRCDMPPPQLRYSRDLGNLGLSGHILTKVATTGAAGDHVDYNPAALGPSGIVKTIAQWRKLLAGESKHRRRSSDQVDPAAKFARTMFRNRFRGAADSNERTLQQLNDLLDNLKQGILDPSNPAQQALDESLSSSRFFVTSDGRPGLGPLDTQPGDRLALIMGGDVPYVLRKSIRWEGERRTGSFGSQDSEPTPLYEGGVYTFVGECYVDKAMDGQVFNENEVHEIWLE